MSAWRRSTAGELVGGIPPVILTFMVTCLAAWLLAVPTWSAWPGWRWLELSAGNLGAGRIWTLLTYQFLHSPGGPFHLVFNMLNLWFFGRALERRWPRAEFITFYLTCGVGGGLVFAAIAFLLGSSAPVIGASGAVLGLLVAYAMIWPHQVISIFGLWSIQARHFVLIVAGIDFLIAWVDVAGQGSPAGPLAHLGGMATAWLYMRGGWQLSRIGRFLALPGKGLDRLKWAWRKRNLKSVEKDWERMLHDDDIDRRSH